MFEILEAIIESNNINIFPKIPDQIFSVENYFCNRGFALIYLVVVVVWIAYETFTSAKRLRLILQRSIVYFLIDVSITQGK